jgi:lipoyl-dependent peroxiredoxin
MENLMIKEQGVTDKIVYTGKTHTTGGRDGGVSKSTDGHLDIKLSTPGTGKPGTNPEQLFAAGWSACFIGAMKKSAANLKVAFPADSAVDTEVELVLSDSHGYSLRARLAVTLPGIDKAIAQTIADGAHQICPYSKATRGNIDVVIHVN